MVRDEAESATIRTASDYSYSASSYAGENYRLVGDAAVFIDPFFSSGVHLAMTTGLAAAASISSSIRGDCPESDAAEWHTQRVGISYTRFLIVVLGSYKQMRAQSEHVLSDVGENNFDRAFDFLRPVIQGSADLGPRISENEVQNALDFCVDLFDPSDQGEANDLRKYLEGIDDGQFSAHGAEKSVIMNFASRHLPAKDVQNTARDPSSLPAVENGSAEEGESEVRRVLEKINARRLLHREYTGLHALEEESLGAGYSLRLESGRLGLTQSLSKAVNNA
jgi:hypothetical protein